MEQEEGFSKPGALIVTLAVVVLLSAYWLARPTLVDEKMSLSCEINADCTLLLCSGAVNKEWAKNAPPDLPCAQYEGYIAQCTEQKCTAIKP